MAELNWDRIRALFEAASELTGRMREEFLARECGDDPSTRREVEALLEASSRGSFGTGVGLRAGLHAVGDQIDQASVPDSEKPGTHLGPYVLIEPKGFGGFARVHVAEQMTPVRRRVAIKIINTPLGVGVFEGRFETEKQALAVMDHPGIAKVFDAGMTEDKRPYIAMELVEGKPITRYCDQARLCIRERLELFCKVCDAVQHAHSKTVVHRDLTPSNILAFAGPMGHAAKVIDFGIAKALGSPLAEKTAFTQEGMLLGTPAYMSPEQAAGSRDVDIRSDVYSLGVVLYELLSGTPPFDPERLRSAAFDEIVRVIRVEEPPRPSVRLSRSTSGAAMQDGSLSVRQGRTGTDATQGSPISDGTNTAVPVKTAQSIADARATNPRQLAQYLRSDLDWIVMRAMEKEAARRYQTVEAFAADVRRFLRGEAVNARPPSVVYRARKFVKRNKGAVAAVSALVVAFSAGFVGTAYGMVQAKTKQAEADFQRMNAVATTEVMVRVLRGAGPAVARGRDATVLKEMLDDAATRVLRGDLREYPRSAVWVSLTLGQVYDELGDYEKARNILESALALIRGESKDSEELAECLNTLARNGVNSGAPADQCEARFAEAISVRRRLHPADDQKLAVAINNLGIFRMRAGNLVGAEALIREALAIRQKAHSESDPSVLSSLSTLAALLDRQGKSAEAEKLIRQELSGRRANAKGSDDLDVAFSQSNLGRLLQKSGNFTEAEQLCRDSLAMFRRLYSGDHADVAMAIMRLGGVSASMDRLADAETLLREAAAMYGRVYPHGHANSAECLCVLAECEQKAGERDQALGHAEEALSIAKAVLKPGHPLLAHCEATANAIRAR